MFCHASDTVNLGAMEVHFSIFFYSISTGCIYIYLLKGWGSNVLDAIMISLLNFSPFLRIFLFLRLKFDDINFRF